jgi:hypothetical protein
VKTERKDVGVPLSVVDHPDEDAVGVCAAAASRQEKRAVARTKRARGMAGSQSEPTAAVVHTSLRTPALHIPARRPWSSYLDRPRSHYLSA